MVTETSPAMMSLFPMPVYVRLETRTMSRCLETATIVCRL
jgi:hypothetical protein